MGGRWGIWSESRSGGWYGGRGRAEGAIGTVVIAAVAIETVAIETIPIATVAI